MISKMVGKMSTTRCLPRTEYAMKSNIIVETLEISICWGRKKSNRVMEWKFWHLNNSLSSILDSKVETGQASRSQEAIVK